MRTIFHEFRRTALSAAGTGVVAAALLVGALPVLVSARLEIEELAGDIGSELPSVGTFDLGTTTDTEVVRIGQEVDAARLNAAVTDLAAGTNFVNREVELRSAEKARAEAETALEITENTVQAAAINTFVTDSSVDTTDSLGESLEHQRHESLASDTIDQLLANRELAQLALADAVVDIEVAEDRLEAAGRRKLVTSMEVAATTNDANLYLARAERHSVNAELADAAAAALSTDHELQSVAGALVVNVSIEQEIDRLIADARADGLNLSGDGFRTIEAQIALRIAHCGGTGTIPAPGTESSPEVSAAEAAALADARNYAIYEAPASSCSPPTAKPGESEHQSGMAIDFTLDGQILTRDSPGFLWLTERSADYGLINLPSEAWHWSTTGR